MFCNLIHLSSSNLALGVKFRITTALLVFLIRFSLSLLFLFSAPLHHLREVHLGQIPQERNFGQNVVLFF